MPDIIKLLPDSIANQIAAGEVIQRPASAVKELLENAIDAGADHIELILKDSGKTMIKVVDNGAGMSETDARMAFERHATSKIRAAEDLFAIQTMGFRGEALASIAAIAQVELKTRKLDQELGSEIIIEGSQVISQEPCQCLPGTSFTIKNLFYNTPARRNFLKSNTVELRHIVEEFQRVALANPAVGFKLFHNGLEMFNLPASNLRKRIVAVFGNNYNQRLVPIDESTSVVEIRGFIGKPEFAKKTRGEQYFFVNNRFIKSPYLQHAIISAYEDLISSGSFPLFVLFLKIDPARIDVNVHPTKQEIKFEDERIIYAYLHSAVKRGLSKYSVAPTLDFEQDNNLDQMGVSWNFQQQPNAGQQQAPERTNYYDPFAGKYKEIPYAPTQSHPQQEHDPGEVITVPSRWDHEQEVPEEEYEQYESQPYQLHGRYIISPIKNGLIIIDQQAAHERVLFERYMRSMANNRSTTQKQLFPQTVQLTTADASLLRDILPDVQMLGFDIQEFGKNDFVVHGIPGDVTGGNEQEVIEGLLEQFKMNEQQLKLKKRENLARSMAVQTCIKGGKKLSAKEMQTLMDELFACENFTTAPSGRMVFAKFSLQDIDKILDKRN